MTDFLFAADCLALDFVNTVLVRDGVETDLLENASDLRDWYAAAGIHAGAVGPAPGGRKAFTEAIAFREALRAGFLAVAQGQKLPSGLVDSINAVLARAPGYLPLRRGPEGWNREFVSGEGAYAGWLARVAGSAADLICEGYVGLVKQCRGKNCILLFHDGTRGKTRRWCSMQTCGNRAKAAAHFRRRKKR